MLWGDSVARGLVHLRSYNRIEGASSPASGISPCRVDTSSTAQGDTGANNEALGELVVWLDNKDKQVGLLFQPPGQRFQ